MRTKKEAYENRNVNKLFTLSDIGISPKIQKYIQLLGFFRDKLYNKKKQKHL